MTSEKQKLTALNYAIMVKISRIRPAVRHRTFWPPVRANLAPPSSEGPTPWFSTCGRSYCLDSHISIRRQCFFLVKSNRTIVQHLFSQSRTSAEDPVPPQIDRERDHPSTAAAHEGTS